MKSGLKRFLIMLMGCLSLCLATSACSTKISKDVYYESQIRFYVTPENPINTGDGSEYGVYGAYGEHIMDNMVKLLNEDFFAEEMLLCSQDTDDLSDEEKALYKYLPMKNVWTSENEAELSKSLNEAIDIAIPFVTAIVDAEEARVTAWEEYIKAVEVHNLATAELETVWFDVFGTNYSDLKYNYITDEDRQKEGFVDVQAAYKKERSEEVNVIQKYNEVDTASFLLRQARNNAQSPRAEVFNLWCQTAKYKTFSVKYSESTHFSFSLVDEDREDTNKFARSLIYANISVKGEDGYILANELYEILQELVPEYVERNMVVPSGYTSTNCQRISRNDTPQRVKK